MGEVKDAVASEVHLEHDNKDETFIKTNIKPLNEIPRFPLSFIKGMFWMSSIAVIFSSSG